MFGLKKIAALAMTMTVAFSAAAMNVGGNNVTASAVTAASGNAQKWINRVDLPSYAKKFYSVLEEAADGDKKDDFLIDVYSTQNIGSGQYAILVNTVSGKTTSKSKVESICSSELDKTTKNMRAVYDAFKCDHPEIFWLSGATKSYCSYSYSSSGSEYSYTEKIYFVVKNSSFDVRSSAYSGSNGKTKIYSDIKKRNSYVNSIIGGVKSTASDYDKIKHFNKSLTAINEYNTSVSSAPVSSWECLAALKGSTGSNGPVCEGYSKAFKVLCDKAGIPCVLVTGAASNDEGTQDHMWNNVKLDGKWYAVDVTWNDPTVKGVSGAVSGKETTKWLAVGSGTSVSGKKFSVSHKIINMVSVDGFKFTNGPTLNSSKYVPLTKPAKVKVSSYTASTSSVNLKWKKVSGATGYRVYRYNSSTKKWDTIKTISSSSTLSYKDTGLKAGTVYYYKVKAYAKGGGTTLWGDASDKFTVVTKCAKVNITKGSKGKTAVRLYWDKITCTGYKIQQYDSEAGKWVTIAKVASSETNYKITGLSSGTVYKYRIQAYKVKDDQTASGAWSDTKKVTTLA